MRHALLILPLLLLASVAPAYAADTIVVQACTWFQLQCWFYPFLFYMVFMVLVLVVGALGRVSARGMTYMMFVSLAFASGVEVMMGIMTIALPLILTIITTVYAWRFR